MSSTHLVKQGEHLARIAFEHGFGDFHTIWNHPQNADLKKKRINPHILFPGDLLFIPDREERVESRATEKRHRFELLADPLKLRLAIKDVANKPLKDIRCRLVIETNEQDLATDSKGIIEQQIPKDAETGSLLIRPPNDPLAMQIPFKIGHLDPIDTESGQAARLNNLGYLARDTDEIPSTPEEKKRVQEQFRSAVEEFQCDHRPPLTVDGICGPQTQAKLKEVHGC